MSDVKPATEPEIERVAHEDPKVRTRRVLAFSLGYVAFAILLAGGLGIYYRAIIAGQPLTARLQAFPAPQLQPNPTQDWEAFHARQVADLRGSGCSRTPHAEPDSEKPSRSTQGQASSGSAAAQPAQDQGGGGKRDDCVATLPIEEAKTIIAARGAKAYDPPEGTPPYMTTTGAPLDGAPRATPQPMAAPFGDVH